MVEVYICMDKGRRSRIELFKFQGRREMFSNVLLFHSTNFYCISKDNSEAFMEFTIVTILSFFALITNTSKILFCVKYDINVSLQRN